MLSLTLLFSFFAFLNALGFCLSENEVSAKSATHISGSISCLDKEEELFLYEVYQGHKSFYFSKWETRFSILNSPEIFPTVTFNPAVCNCLAAIFASFS